MKYDNVKFETAEVVFNKLGGLQGVNDFLSGKTKIIKVTDQLYFRVWKKIMIGNYENNDGLIKALTNPHCNVVSNHSNVRLDEIVHRINPIFSKTKKEKKLINVSLKEMGFKRFWQTPSLSEIITRAEEIGFEFCTDEDSFELGIQLTERTKDSLHMITKSGITFYLSWGDCELYFYYHYHIPSAIFQKKDRFVFSCPEPIII